MFGIDFIDKLATEVELIEALGRRDIQEAIRLTDELKVVMDTYEHS